MLKNDQIKEENKTISQWLTVNNNQHILKLVCFGLMGISLLLVILCFNLQDKTPTVVTDRGGDLYYLAGSKAKTPIKEDNIERFVKIFIKLRYEWDGNLDFEKISKNISPFVTNGFRLKTIKHLRHLKTKEFKGKNIDQSHTTPRITVTEKKTMATFDRVLRINGVPLPIPTQISFNLVKGKVTFWNRLGLYINGIIIHEGL